MRRECRERFPPPPISKETVSWRSRHASRHVRDARAVMHVGIACLWWRGKRSRHSRRMRTRKFAYLARGPWNKNSFHVTGPSWRESIETSMWRQSNEYNTRVPVFMSWSKNVNTLIWPRSVLGDVLWTTLNESLLITSHVRTVTSKMPFYICCDWNFF